MPRPLKATLDSGALRHNLAIVRHHARRASVFAVVKANAYGHGLMSTVRALGDADGVALLELDAGVRLRDAGYSKRLALLEGVFDAADLQVAADHNLTIVVHSNEQLQLLASAPRDARFDVMLKVNCGMNRLGFSPRAAAAALDKLQSHRAVGEVTLMAHFATADEARGVAWQMKVFDEVALGSTLQRSVANSAALLRYPESHADWVRPGIMLYGCSPFSDVSAEQLGLKPVMTLTSEIIAVQELNAGDQVGYGGTFEATRAMRAGIIACGYADGYPRHAPTGTPVLVGGRRTRTLGRVAMDMLCADLTEIPEARVGTEVTLWGTGLPVEEVAISAGTVSYELLCALATRVPIVEV